VENIKTAHRQVVGEVVQTGVRTAPKKPPLLVSWFRSHVASLLATAMDFLVTIFLTEVAAVWYVLSNALGAAAGGAVSFTLCRLWVFNRRQGRLRHQAFRYLLAVGLSLSLNTLGVWFMTETFQISYVISKTVAAVVVGISVNFLVFRYFVFK